MKRPLRSYELSSRIASVNTEGYTNTGTKFQKHQEQSSYNNLFQPTEYCIKVSERHTQKTAASVPERQYTQPQKLYVLIK